MTTKVDSGFQLIWFLVNIQACCRSAVYIWQWKTKYGTTFFTAKFEVVLRPAGSMESVKNSIVQALCWRIIIQQKGRCALKGPKITKIAPSGI